MTNDSPVRRLPDATSLRGALAEAERALAAAGVASPRPDAEELAAHLLSTDRGRLWQHLDAPTPAGFGDLVQRRAGRVPLQHITGRAYFRHLTLHVGPGVFVPRPETEVVVGHAIELLESIQSADPTRRLVAVDLGAGSGAIALSLALEVPLVDVLAVEADPGVMPWLQRNAADSRVQVHHGDLTQSLAGVSNHVDVVVSNPPYIPREAVPRDLEVARFDPPQALYSGADGLDHIRAVEQVAHRLLRHGGYVVVEHADQQGRSAPAVFSTSAGWVDVSDHVDLVGRPRYLVARRDRFREGSG
ncbi:MAG: peptide chain release factor N(5)-glutamine methyltransferase [Actinomycetes bacterium]